MSTNSHRQILWANFIGTGGRPSPTYIPSPTLPAFVQDNGRRFANVAAIDGPSIDPDALCSPAGLHFRFLDFPVGLRNSPVGLLDSPMGMPGSPMGMPDSPMGMPDSPMGLPDSPMGLPVSPVGLPDSPMGLLDSPVGMLTFLIVPLKRSLRPDAIASDPDELPLRRGLTGVALNQYVHEQKETRPPSKQAAVT